MAYGSQSTCLWYHLAVFLYPPLCDFCWRHILYSFAIAFSIWGWPGNSAIQIPFFFWTATFVFPNSWRGIMLFSEAIVPVTEGITACLHININSLKTSWGALKDTIRTYSPKPDIIGISETKNPAGRKILPIPGYQAFRNDAKSGTRGTAIYVR